MTKFSLSFSFTEQHELKQKLKISVETLLPELKKLEIHKNLRYLKEYIRLHRLASL